MKKLFLLIPALFTLLLMSCGSSSDTDPGGDGPVIKDSGKQDGTNDSIGYRSTKSFFQSLPSPLAMAAVFSSSGLKFIDGLGHDPDRADNYSSVKSKAINLGIYGADLAYCVVNDQPGHSRKYLKAVKLLSDGLEMGSIFNSDDYLERFETNINRKDSLAMIISELKQEMDLFLNENEKENMALFVFSGSWIESIYISTQSIKNKKNESISRTIAEQKYILDNLVDLLTDYEKEPNFKDLFLALTDLKSSFDKTTTKVGDDVAITNFNEQALKEITDKVATIRNQFITP